MGKRLVLILVCALLVGLMALPAFAAVQNIKVSGDLTMLGIGRSSFNMGGTSTGPNYFHTDDNENHLSSILRLRVDADLTEKVSVTTRLLNERDWDVEAASLNEIGVDLASVTLKEFLYSPLTLTLGRQELHFGNDFIIGDPNTNNQSVGTSLTDADLSSKKAFDALRATLNYDPLVVDLFMAKIDENTILGNSTNPERDDINLYGINARYDFGGKYKTIGELYYFGRKDRSPIDNTTGTNNKTANIVNNIGGRIDISPIERLNLQGEMAIQSGKINNDTVANSVEDVQAWAAQGIATYALNMKYKPVLQAIYSYYSGDKNGAHATDANRNWDPMYENQTAGHIINVLFNNTDSHNLNLRASIVPLEDLTVTLDYVWLQLAKSLPIGATVNTFNQNHTTMVHAIKQDVMHLGDEVDLTLKYAYTEDVELGLMAGVFIPGNVFDKAANRVNNVNEVIASCKVSF